MRMLLVSSHTILLIPSLDILMMFLIIMEVVRILELDLSIKSLENICLVRKM